MYLSLQSIPSLNLRLPSFSFKRTRTLAISVLFIGLIAPGSVFASGAFLPRPFTSLVVISLGNDIAINHATDQIRMIIPGAVFLSASNEEQLRAITRMAVREIIYVGHGLPQGLEVGSSLISWQEVQSIVKESPAIAQMFAACFSLAANVAGSNVIGFKGLVDVDEAAMWVTSVYYSIENQASKIPQILSYFFGILLAKVINPTGQLLAFLGPPIPNCIPTPKQGSMVQPNGCGGCGCACYGCGPPPPSCNNSAQWISGFQVMYVNGVCMVHWNDAYLNHVTYTHPDSYITYPWLTVNYNGGVQGNNLIGAHVPQSTLDQYSIADIFATIGGTLLVAAILAPPISTVVAALAAAIVAAIGASIAVFIQYDMRDEQNAGWVLFQNWYNVWYGWGTDVKMGQFMWMKMGITLGITFGYPLWYGGRDLGIGGW